ncbi:MAG TPA: DNRLRE domain-containing protein [Jatrophihabitans sp.]
MSTWRRFRTGSALGIAGTMWCGVVAGVLFGVGSPALGDTPPVPGGLADASSAASEDHALVIAQAFQHEVQVSSDTTETSEVYAQPDGSMRMSTYLAPVRVMRPSGWVPVDATLSRLSDGSVRPAATSMPLRFSGGGAGPIAAVQTGSGQWVSVSWPNGPLPTPILSGDVATYPNVLPGVDLRLAAQVQGFSEVLVVKSAEAARQPALTSMRFAIDDGALTSTPLPGGGLESKSDDGTVQVREGQPTWWDSTGFGSDADGPGDNGVPRPIPGATSTSTSLTINASAVASAASVKYPVFVDPSFPGGRRQAWTFTDSAYPTTNYLNGSGASDSYAHSGYVNAAWSDDGRAHLTRAFFQMNMNGLQGRHILSAQLNTTLAHSSSCTPTAVSLRAANAAIGPATTWRSQPSLGTVQDTKAGAWRPDCPNGGTSGLAMGFNATPIVRLAAAGKSARVTLALQSTNESDARMWKKFRNNPTLAVQYNTVPSAPAARSITPCYLQCASPTVTSRVDPTLTATAGDRDGGTIHYNFEIWAGHSASPTSRLQSYLTPARAQGAVTSWLVPASPPVGQHALVNGGQYEYRVRAYDGTDYGPWSSGWAQFSVDTSAPPAPDAHIVGATTDQNVDPSHYEGIVGKPITVDFSTTRDASTAEIVYSLYDKIPVYAKAPACGSGTDGVVVVCRIGGVYPVQTIAPIDTGSVLYLMAFDVAGNRSSTGSVPFYVNADWAGVETGHSWKIDPATTGSIPDTAASAGQPLLEGAGVGRGLDEPNPDGFVADPVTSEKLPVPVVAVSTFAGQGAAKASAAVLTMSQSFTVAAWVKPTSTAASSLTAASAFAIAAQEGPLISGFFVDVYRNQWRFCMPSTQNSTFDGACVRSTGVAVNAWTFIAAQWDAVNHQLRLTVGEPGSPLVASHSVTASADGVFDIGIRNQPGQLFPWVGGIYGPAAIQAVATPAQLDRLRDFYSPAAI